MNEKAHLEENLFGIYELIAERRSEGKPVDHLWEQVKEIHAKLDEIEKQETPRSREEVRQKLRSLRVSLSFFEEDQSIRELEGILADLIAVSQAIFNLSYTALDLARKEAPK